MKSIRKKMIQIFTLRSLVGLCENPFYCHKTTCGWQYKLYASAVLALLILHALTISLDILDPQVHTSIALLGDDVCIIIGVIKIYNFFTL